MGSTPTPSALRFYMGIGLDLFAKDHEDKLKQVGNSIKLESLSGKIGAIRREFIERKRAKEKNEKYLAVFSSYYHRYVRVQ